MGSQLSRVSGHIPHPLWQSSSAPLGILYLTHPSWTRVIGFCCCLQPWPCQAAEQQSQKFSPFLGLLGKNVCVCVCVCVYARVLSCGPLFDTPWTVARQAPLSTEFRTEKPPLKVVSRSSITQRNPTHPMAPGCSLNRCSGHSP